MPILYQIDESKNRVCTQVSGSVSVLEILGHFEMLRQEKFLERKEFIDVSSIVSPTLSPMDVGKTAIALLKMINNRAAIASRAVLVGNETILKQVQIFASLICNCVTMEVFLDRTAAEEWLEQQEH